jgi:NIPSNAP
MNRREVLQGMGAAVMLSMASGLEGQSGAKSDVVYELREYHANEGKLDTLLARFRDHTITIFNRHGMKSIAYWTPTDEPLKGKTLVYILEHPSRAAAAANWETFHDDPEWVKVAAASEANGKLVEKVDSTYMSATDFSRAASGGGWTDVATPVYELRIYHTNEGKLEPLLKRFREKETAIFRRLGMYGVGYWTADDEPLKDRTLIYILKHKSREAATESWAQFAKDPEWVKLKAESEAGGAFVEKRESIFMTRTKFSPKV